MSCYVIQLSISLNSDFGVSAACVYITNDRFTVAIKYADGSIADNLDDVNSYVNNTVMVSNV
jgi:hypothetical protein